MMREMKKRIGIIWLLLIICFTAYIYRDFLFGNRIFVSKYDAMDNYDQSYPYSYNLARLLSKDIPMPCVSFNIGLGEEVSFDFFSIDNLTSAFGKENVAYLCGILAAIKVVLSYLFFYLYVVTLGKKEYVACICGTAYAFSGIMILRQYWMSYSTEMVFFSLCLFTLELWIMKDDIRWFPIGVFLLAANYKSTIFSGINMYRFLWYNVILITYIVFRLIYEKKRVLCKKSIIVVLGCIVINRLISGVPSLINSLSNVITSERMRDATTSAQQLFGQGIVYGSEKNEITTLICNVLGTGIQGYGRSYLGKGGLLQHPTFYVGFVVLLMVIPCLIRIKDTRKRILNILIICAVTIYVFFTPVRILCNGMSASGFKLSSLWIVVAIIYIVAQGMDDVLQGAYKSDYLVVAFSELAIIGILLFISNRHSDYRMDIIKNVGVLSVLISLTLILCFTYKKIIFFYLIMFLCIIDGFYNMSNCVTNYDMSDTVSIESGEYNDSTMDAISYIANNSESSGYRIDKQFTSYGFNDSWYQNYNGFSYYVGGTGIGNDIIRFYRIFNLPATDETYKYTYGIGTNTYVGSLLGSKYVLSKSKELLNYGYELLSQVGDIYIFENKYDFGMGFVYDRQILKNEFEKMSDYEKSLNILQACIIDSDDKDLLPELIDAECIHDMDYIDYEIDFTEVENGIQFSKQSKDDVVLIDFTPLSDDQRWRTSICYLSSDGITEMVHCKIDPDKKTRIEINSELVNQIFFVSDLWYENYIFQHIKVYSVPKEIYYANYRSCYDRIRDSIVHIDSFSGNVITGSVESDNDGVLFLSIPYRDWELTIDGIIAETFPINYAFIGTNIKSGKHSIEIVYKGLNTKLILSIRSLFLVFYALWLFIVRIRKQKA